MSDRAAPYVLPDADVDERVAASVGGKALALARLGRAGLAVPPFSVVTTAAYEAFVHGPLATRILFELERKDVADMRWEELWDAALRIRNLFLATPLPAALGDALRAGLRERFGRSAVVVRSSARGEDSARASFAGLHESYVNVRGIDAIVEHVRLVWASLWSDAALLYRRELGLDPLHSAMAVVVQKIVAGERSGVAFSRHPEREDQALVEAVHGLNQGLVDGTVEPDRWVLERTSGAVLEHDAPERLQMMAPGRRGVRLVPLPPARRQRPPLGDGELERVHALARGAETSFALPQDVEWTLAGAELFTLQSRPITTGGRDGDGRAAYLGLRRSYDNLVELRRRIEDEALPAMAALAQELAAVALGELGDDRLLAELTRRKAAHEQWLDVYTREFVPFAHAVRLFGQAYNDALRPDDPYEFVSLLSGTPMASLRRNAALVDLAKLASDADEATLDGRLEAFLDEFGLEPSGAPGRERERATMRAVIARLAASPAPPTPPVQRRDELEERYLAAAGDDDGRERAAGLLDLARAGWRLRDDDNASLDRLAAHLTAALAEARRRGLEVGSEFEPAPVTLPSPVRGVPSRPTARHGPNGDATAVASPSAAVAVRARQLVGQPAGPGVGIGPARVVRDAGDLAMFEEGDVLVCDAIEPGMTFVVPLSAGIVERRGGMLIHGAIIAREYGLPCVTGVPHATDLIASGDRLTVDGYLGIVVVG
jgi:rifampicin phosphotransferase